MMKPGSFFRVFDSAFFVPGLYLYAGLHWLGVASFPEELGSEAMRAAVTGALLIAGFYAGGVVLHGISRLLLAVLQQLRKRNRDTSQNQVSWYRYLDREQREELAIYFWHTRATCHSLAVASLALAAIAAYRRTWSPVCPTLLVAGVFVFLSLEFDGALRRAVQCESGSEGGPT